MPRKRGTLSPKIPSNELTQALNHAAQAMKTFKRRVMTAELLLQCVLKVARHQCPSDFTSTG